jgi:hypothetical protein
MRRALAAIRCSGWRDVPEKISEHSPRRTIQ